MDCTPSPNCALFIDLRYGAILVCDMPVSKCLLRHNGGQADLSQSGAIEAMAARTQKAPEVPGPWSQVVMVRNAVAASGSLQTAVLTGSEPETGQVAIAHRDPAAFDQKAVDEGHQAAEQRAGGQEGDRCGLGHGLSPF